MKYLKQFNELTEYELFKISSDFVYPNVSYIGNASVIYNSLPKEEPSEPEDDVIEYHFEIPMENNFLIMEGTLEGDFTEIHSKLMLFITTNDEATIASKVNITVNGDKVISLSGYPNSPDKEIIGITDSAKPSTFTLYPTRVYYSQDPF